jgi:hypothetical protein
MRTLRLFKTVIIYSLLMILTLSLNSCFIAKAISKGKARREFTEENKAIPPSFGKANEVILCILQDRNSYDKFLKSAFKKKYKGDYVLVYKPDLYSAKYADKEKYRYVFDYDGGSIMTTAWSDGLSASSTMKRYYIYDRLENTKYQTGGEFGFFALAMRCYVENLEIKRLSNSN